MAALLPLRLANTGSSGSISLPLSRPLLLTRVVVVVAVLASSPTPATAVTRSSFKKYSFENLDAGVLSDNVALGIVGHDLSNISSKFSCAGICDHIGNVLKRSCDAFTFDEETNVCGVHMVLSFERLTRNLGANSTYLRLGQPQQYGLVLGGEDVDNPGIFFNESYVLDSYRRACRIHVPSSQHVGSTGFAKALISVNSDVLYQAGGRPGVASNKVSKLALRQEMAASWTPLPNLISARTMPAFVQWNDLLFVIGGTDVPSKVEYLDLLNPLSWTELPNFTVDAPLAVGCQAYGHIWFLDSGGDVFKLDMTNWPNPELRNLNYNTGPARTNQMYIGQLTYHGVPPKIMVVAKFLIYHIYDLSSDLWSIEDTQSGSSTDALAHFHITAEKYPTVLRHFQTPEYKQYVLNAAGTSFVAQPVGGTPLKKLDFAYTTVSRNKMFKDYNPKCSTFARAGQLF